MTSGFLDLPWWGLVLAALALTHVTIASVTIFLHRHQAHRALELHPLMSHFFRFWLWLTTGMVTREWVAVHRKHHARCETEEDPHSPQVLGLNRVLWGGVWLYRKETMNAETMEKYGQGTPDDWLERHIYTPHNTLGLVLMGLIDLALFGLPGLVVLAVQIVWIPFWAAGVINGVAHFWGYRNFACDDASRNIVPWGVLIGGEELHNNHHAYAASARLSNKWYELDIGWVYIRAMELLGLAKVKRVAPPVKFDLAKARCDMETLQAVITHRYHVLAGFARAAKTAYVEEARRLRSQASQALPVKRLKAARALLNRDASTLGEHDRETLAEVLSRSRPLQTVYVMRQELSTLWERSSASKEQMLKHLEDWCVRAEASGVAALQEFSRTLRCYA